MAGRSPLRDGAYGAVPPIQGLRRGKPRRILHPLRQETGPRRLPSKSFTTNTAWCLIVALACDLLTSPGAVSAYGMLITSF